MRSFEERVVALTGASSGIGRALATNLAGRGAELTLADRDAEGLAETADLARTAGARVVHETVLDVADPFEVEAWAAKTVGDLGRVNVLFTNAGVSLVGDFGDLALADMRWIVDVNFWGVVHATRAFLPHLIDSGEGHLVVTSSLFGLMTVPSQSLYAATKFAVRGLGETLREELLVSGAPVGVTVVHPGGVKTAIARNARFARHEDRDGTVENFDEHLAATSPEWAAEVIVKGVLRGKPRVLVGADARVVHHLTRLAGARYQDVVARVSRRARAAMKQPS